MKLIHLTFILIAFTGCLEQGAGDNTSVAAPSQSQYESELPAISDCVMTIYESGEYVLDRDIETNSCAIEIKSNNVKLNLNGHTLRGPSDPKTASIGIKSIDNSFVEVYNGKIDGFLFGIALVSAIGRGDTTWDNFIHDLEVTNSSQKAIRAGGYNVKVTNNSVKNTGGTEFTADTYGFGIEVRGPSCIVSNNRIIDTYGGALASDGFINEGVAISFSHFSTYCIAENNYIENSIIVTDKSTFGFWVDVYSMVTLKDNYIRNMHYSGVVPNFTILENNDLDKPMIYKIDDRE